MKILITGAAGFIGEFVVSDALSRGHQIIALVRSLAPNSWKGIANLEVIRHDLRVVPSLDLRGKDIDVVLHLAAATKGRVDEQFQDTVLGTRNLLKSVEKAGIRRIVGISSIAVVDYSSVPPLTLIDELVVAPSREGLGAYAATKLQQESLLLKFGAEVAGSCTILRPGLVYDESRLVPAHAGIIRGRFCLLAGHAGEVPTIEVHGLARAIVNAAELDLKGCDVIHLVDDHLPSQLEYIAGLRRRGLLPRRGIVVPWRILESFSWILGGALRAAGLGEKLPEFLLPKGFSARLKPFRFSNSKAKNLLNWTPGRQFA
jgi:nucleoside-diphosphate-sugar epimerase